MGQTRTQHQMHKNRSARSSDNTFAVFFAFVIIHTSCNTHILGFFNNYYLFPIFYYIVYALLPELLSSAYTRFLCNYILPYYDYYCYTCI